MATKEKDIDIDLSEVTKHKILASQKRQRDLDTISTYALSAVAVMIGAFLLWSCFFDETV